MTEKTLRLMAVPVCVLLTAIAAEGAWSTVPLETWTRAQSMDTSIGLHPTPAEWLEQDGRLTIRGKANCWDTRLLPGDQSPDTRVTVDFTINSSAKQPRRLPPISTYRWGYHYAENVSGWDVGLVLRYRGPLNHYRLSLSGHRKELALWDSLGEFLQFAKCPVTVGAAHRLDVVSRGAHIVATLDGEKVLDYWDRNLPHTEGQMGLSVWRSDVTIDRYAVTPLSPVPLTPPKHQPDFHFEQDGEHAILFDGFEPIARFHKATRGNVGALTIGNIKLKPGNRPSYYTWYGPAITPGPGHGVLPLVGELPDALRVSRTGEQLHMAFDTNRPDTAKAEHQCVVRFDEVRGVYRYEYKTHLTFTSEGPFKINAFELIDPLTQNNRPPGPEVTYRWNAAEHRWHLYQAPDLKWYRYPLIDHLAPCANRETRWGKFTNLLYPDSGACPTFELGLDWERDPKRRFELGLCHWGYDFHHRETGNGDPVLPGHERRFSVTMTGMPMSEARKIFAASTVSPEVAEHAEAFAVFNPAGSTFAETSTRPDPKSMTVWRDAKVDAGVGRRDSHSLRIDGPGKGWVQIYQHAIEANAERWWVRGWCRSRGVTGRGLQLRTAYSYSDKPEQIFYMDARGDTEWTRFSFITDVFKKRDCTNVVFELDGAGCVWLDDVAVSALAPDQTPDQTPRPVPTDLVTRNDVLIDLPMDAEATRGVYDVSHNGHHLMLEGSPQWLQENGRGFLRFDGEEDGATIPLKPRLLPLDYKAPVGQIKTLFPLESFSYEFWARPQLSPTGATMSLLNFRWNARLEFRRFNATDGTCLLYYQNDRRLPEDRWHGTGEVRIEKRVPCNTWLHIVTTHKDGKVVLYIDGEPTGEAEYDPETPGFEFFMVGTKYHIGWAYGGGRRYRGDIGPIRLHAAALSPSGVADAFRNGWPVVEEQK
ncbi:MAG: LamG domain-containing protein [Lentisphaerae bacterium]|jgi:hypothetical protein|nr:LamG domain-containing protein [Lentisphaerota bacterium]MBT4821955.1 LamG domain-containing protein [Lentisphaerota bacterium]MBT5605759.1 LamG domain-containing protein [Lentisphaerota bacterium]MBT7053918.1 LamG domain-containing protein [Lentisphaerota bacterium]MBT7843940.1 LamG domain-containing protein [Lentisphaerota bacterium]